MPDSQRLFSAIGFVIASFVGLCPGVARAQYYCPGGYPVDCGDGWCCPSGSSCVGGGMCQDSAGGGSKNGGSACSAEFPLHCEGINKCCPPGTTCGEEGCCEAVTIEGCTTARVCGNGGAGYIEADGVRFDCSSDCEQAVADYCYDSQDSGCAVAPAAAVGTSRRLVADPGGLVITVPGALIALAIVARRKRRADGSARQGDSPRPRSP